MSAKTPWIYRLALSVLLGVCAGAAVADDSEIFFGSSSTGSIGPNILFILDTSGSMSSPVKSQTDYDPTVDYTPSGGNGCVSATIYYLANNTSGTIPGCPGGGGGGGGNARALVGTLTCAAATAALASPSGSYTDQGLVQWRYSSSSKKYAWNAQLGTNATTSFEVRCQGDFPASGGPYPTTDTGTTSTALTTTVANKVYWTNGSPTLTPYTLYSGNYLNWYNYGATVTIGTRESVVQQAATNLINQLSNVNVGLMRYSDNGGNGDLQASGGMVVAPIGPIATNKATVLNAIAAMSAGGYTPLSETMYEAYLYFSGGGVFFGNHSVVNNKPFLSVPASRVGGAANAANYQSPIQYSCQKNFVVFLTDGLPTQDNEADSLILGLKDEATLGGPCDDTTKPPYTLAGGGGGGGGGGGWGPSATAGKCLSALTKYMFNADLAGSLNGQQNVQSYFIGFGDDPQLAAAFSYLSSAASKGGGQAYTAGDLASLQAVLGSIVTNILQISTTFTAPTVAVNAFNRTQTLNDLYVSVFQPTSNWHWPGNVKKYLVSQGVILDQNGVPAVDPATGFFKSSAQSYWSTAVDGAKIPAGGAASMLPNWDPASTPSRKLYTFIGANPSTPVDLTSATSYSVVASNALLTPTLLGAATAAAATNAINYARGEDLKDENGNGVTTDSRLQMGDPLHAQPAIIIYGGVPGAPDVTDAVVYTATNDGFLHAISTVDGHELWAFIPQDLLPQLRLLQSNPAQSAKHYALDGTVRALKYDVNGDGIIDPAAGDRVIIYFGQGRGGSNYYALDVTNKAAPKYLWTIGPAQLPGIGQAWSTPQIARVAVGGGVVQASNQKLVLIFGGGYDPLEENPAYTSADSVGASIYMVDAVSGALLWSAGGSASSADLKLTRMDHSIPSDIAVLDTNSDGFADRMYVGDMAGQLWRFDINNGNSPSGLVAGGVIASLGTHDDSPSSVPDTRRFYNLPDVSVIERKGMPPYMNVAIGSGYRGHPLDKTANERFYAVRDFNPFLALTPSQYAALKVLHDSDMIDITLSVTPAIAPTDPGWKLLLDGATASPAWIGEKVLAPSSTFNNQVLFTTYTPNLAGSTNSCQPAIGLNKFYAVSVIDGSPVANLNNHNNATVDDRSTNLAQSGIAPQLSFLFPAPTGTTDANGNPISSTQSPVTCMSGVEVLSACRSFGSRLKTYWNETDAP